MIIDMIYRLNCDENFSVIRQNLRKGKLCALWTERRRLKDLDPINDDAMY